MLSKLTIFSVFALVFVFSLSLSASVSYREEKTTPKIYNDRFKMKKEYQNIPDNRSSPIGSYAFGPSFANRFQFRAQADQPKPTQKVKAVLLGDKTMKENDEDEYDDDDGGEYDGFKEGTPEDVKTRDGKDREQQSIAGPSKTKCQENKAAEEPKKPDSMPVMFIRQLDMVAMSVPLQEQKKTETQTQKQKGWSSWSACSKSCGAGVQSRWRVQEGSQKKEQQYRACVGKNCDREYNENVDKEYTYD